MANFKKKYKDSIFTDLFSEKENFLSLYNALHDTNYSVENTKVEDKTIENTVYTGRYNDLSMLLDNKLIVMIEHQSTLNPNIPFRFLEYVTRVYSELFTENLRYSTKKALLPTPEFWVFYNGNSNLQDTSLTLSQMFQSSHNYAPQLELLVNIKNINLGHDLNLQNKCDILKQYEIFVDMAKQEKNKNNPEVCKKLIQQAMNQNILRDYLYKKSPEVVSMLIGEYNYELDLKTHCEEAREDGIKTGIQQGLITSAVTMVKKYNLPVEQVCADLKLSVEEVTKALI